MDKEKVIREVSEIVRNVLKHDDFNLTEEMTAGEIRGWDSLSHMLIITEIEKHFNVKFSFVEVLNFSTMADLFNGIQSKTTH